MIISERYSRQAVIHGFGKEGQKKLEFSKALVVGVGGLGNPAAQYLAAAGVGTIGLMDDDLIGVNNLNRQILYTPDDIGSSKVEKAQSRLRSFNPEISIRIYKRLFEESISHIVQDFNVVLDCLDNLEARLLLNRSCVEMGIPMVHGGALGFSGQLMTIIPHRGPCLSCISPGNRKEHIYSQEGIMGSAAGIIGTLQALEAIKYLSGTGRLVTGRLLIFDGLAGEFEELEIKPNDYCPDCGESSG